MKSTRPTYNTMFFRIAEELANQATCPRKSVGCIIVDQYGVIVSSGWNTSPAGSATCEKDGCILEGGHCVRTLHAEIKALTNAIRSGVRLENSSIYCTLLPCIQCLSALTSAGVRYVHYDEIYDRPERETLFQLAGRYGVEMIGRIR